MSMNTDKAYILGLMVGGGIWGNAEDVFRIRLPYKQWGSYEENPKRASEISRDILTVVSPMFRGVYGINVSFDATTSVWNILCEGDTTELKADLQAYGIACEGELRKNASIRGIIADLADDFMKRRFIAGLADTVGSTNKNHRRFTDNVQILSFELQGFNFEFVCDLCRLLYSIGCYPDQIEWNHPNFHVTRNPYYKQWAKGHKLRVQLDQYASFGAFAFATKAKSAKENRQLQNQTNEAIPCPEREVRATMSCVHPAEHDIRLPASIRGGHYLHNRHVCAVLGCEHAPYDAIEKLFDTVGDLICPFPIMCKDTLSVIEQIIKEDILLADREYSVSRVNVRMFYDLFQEDSTMLLYGDGHRTGYPLTEIMQGIAFIIADDNELNGTRVRGNYIELIERHLARVLYMPIEPSKQYARVAEPTKNAPFELIEGGYLTSNDGGLSVEIRRPDLLTPLVIVGNGRGVLIGARNPRVYYKLTSKAEDNKYKLLVNQVTEDDLL